MSFLKTRHQNNYSPTFILLASHAGHLHIISDPHYVHDLPVHSSHRLPHLRHFKKESGSHEKLQIHHDLRGCRSFLSDHGLFFQLSVWQFDFVDSVLLCPAVIEYVKGLCFYGLLGQLFPLEGNLFVVVSLPFLDTYNAQAVFIVSISIIGMSLVLSFVWREYALIKFEFSPLHVTVQVVHVLVTVAFYVGLFPILQMCFPTREEQVEEMKAVSLKRVLTSFV